MQKAAIDPSQLTVDERKRNIDDAIKWLSGEFVSLLSLIQ